MPLQAQYSILGRINMFMMQYKWVSIIRELNRHLFQASLGDKPSNERSEHVTP